MPVKRKLEDRLPESAAFAMIGGGRRSFMGAIHRAAAAKVAGLHLAAGAFSSSYDESKACAAEFGVPEDMAFWNYRKMLRKFATLPPSRRIAFVSAVLPNALHYPAAMSALDSGVPILVEKPFSCNLDEAANLEWKQRKCGVPLRVAMPYRAYSMLRTAREMIASGELGTLRRFAFSFLSSWMARRIENQGSRGALWRTDVHLNGPGGVVTESIPHMQHVLEWRTGLEISEVAADPAVTVPGRILPDECNTLVRTVQGVHGVFISSRVAIGHREGLAFEISGEKGSLRWRQSMPAEMRFERDDGTSKTFTDGTASGVTTAFEAPFGDNAAFIDALSAVYLQFARELVAGLAVKPEERIGLDAKEGLRSSAVTDAVVRSIASALPAIAAGESSILTTSREIFAPRDDSTALKWTKVFTPSIRL